jgi:hypothetical protein
MLRLCSFLLKPEKDSAFHTLPPAVDRGMSLGEILLAATDRGMSLGLLLQPFFHELNAGAYVARVQVNRRRRGWRQRQCRKGLHLKKISFN